MPKAWLKEHTAADVLRARPGGGTVVYVGRPELTLNVCLEAFCRWNIQNLLILELFNDEKRFASSSPCSTSEDQSLDKEDELQVDKGQNSQLGILDFSILKNNNNRGESEEILVSWLRLEDVLRTCWSKQEGGWGDESRPLVTCREVLRVPAILITVNSSLKDILRFWEESENDWLSPLVLVSDDSKVAGVVTVADVLHYVYLYGYHLDTLMSLSASLLPWSDQALPLIETSALASTCLEMLLDKTCSGLIGLVDRRGTLIGNITIAAFALAHADLDQPLRDFLTDCSYPASLVTCSEHITFGDVLKKILQHQTHHVWRLDAYGRPIGIIHSRHLLSPLQNI